MKRNLSILVCSIGMILLISGMSVAQNGSSSRGYLTTPAELQIIAQKAQAGIEPYKSAVDETLKRANKTWKYAVDKKITCRDADSPKWIDEKKAGIVYAKALAYHLTGNQNYAAEVKSIIENITANVNKIAKKDQQCRLNFAWGIPEYVAAADLIEDYWKNMTCVGPVSTTYKDKTKAVGNCKQVFQNWLIKNPYFIISQSVQSANNWGAAATTATAYIADYLWDRPGVTLVYRQPSKIGGTLNFTPAQAYDFSNKMALDRMNGYMVDYHGGISCDFLSGSQQNSAYPPVKSQVTERGIITDDARRVQYCNIPAYDGSYQNYPQIYLNNTIQQCELMLRRGNSSCYDNIDNNDIPHYQYVAADGVTRTTHLYAGRGSIERAINAIIIDSGTVWNHDNALHLAYNYYLFNSRFGMVNQWRAQMDRKADCSQGICFGKLTHGIADYEIPMLPPTVSPPGT